jgi:hypothetical protein
MYLLIKLMKRHINESDYRRIVKLVLEEKDETNIGFFKKIMSKLKGVSEKQIEYNMKHDLPWDWKGTKEGFYNKMENKRDYSGSN